MQIPSEKEVLAEIHFQVRFLVCVHPEEPPQAEERPGDGRLRRVRGLRGKGPARPEGLRAVLRPGRD